MIPEIATQKVEISSALKTYDTSDIWVNKVSHNRFCYQISNEMDFKDNYPKQNIRKPIKIRQYRM
jgi:hypothetical protein